MTSDGSGKTAARKRKPAAAQKGAKPAADGTSARRTKAAAAGAQASLELWASEELKQATERIGALQREMEHLQAGLAAQREQTATFHERLQILDGRTQRHEATYDTARAVATEVTRWHERLDAEVSLRRDLETQVERALRADVKTEDNAGKLLDEAVTRLDRLEEWRTAEDERQRRLAAGVADDRHEAEGLEGRLEVLEGRLDAMREAARHATEELAREVGVLSRVPGRLDELQERLRAQQQDQRRIDDALAELRSVRDREAELLEVMEQQRATRVRTETRLTEMEQRLESAGREVTESDEERALLARAVHGLEGRMRGLEERVEAQRLLLLTHLRREVSAFEQGARRQHEELEREVRSARELLARFAEESEGMVPESAEGSGKPE
jgi:DNA repair ATPase RecN